MNAVIGIEAECPTCAQPLARVITQTGTGVTTRGILACPQGHEYLLKVELLTTQPTSVGHRDDPYRTPIDIAAGVAQATRAIQAGLTVTAACKAAGIGRHNYYNHQPKAGT